MKKGFCLLIAALLWPVSLFGAVITYEEHYGGDSSGVRYFAHWPDPGAPATGQINDTFTSLGGRSGLYTLDSTGEFRVQPVLEGILKTDLRQENAASDYVVLMVTRWVLGEYVFEDSRPWIVETGVHSADFVFELPVMTLVPGKSYLSTGEWNAEYLTPFWARDVVPEDPALRVDSLLFYSYDVNLRFKPADTAAPVPEPSTLLLLGGALAGAAAWRGLRR